MTVPATSELGVAGFLVESTDSESVVAATHQELGVFGVKPVRRSAFSFKRTVFPMDAVRSAIHEQLLGADELKVYTKARLAGDEQETLLDIAVIPRPEEPKVFADGSAEEVVSIFKRNNYPLELERIDDHLGFRIETEKKDYDPARQALLRIAPMLRGSTPADGNTSK